MLVLSLHMFIHHQLSVVQGSESDNLSNLIAARIKISGMLHSAAATSSAVAPSRPSTPSSKSKSFSFGFNEEDDTGNACAAYSAGAKFGSAIGSSERTTMASSTVNWNGGDTDFQVSLFVVFQIFFLIEGKRKSREG